MADAHCKTRGANTAVNDHMFDTAVPFPNIRQPGAGSNASSSSWAVRTVLTATIPSYTSSERRSLRSLVPTGNGFRTCFWLLQRRRLRPHGRRAETWRRQNLSHIGYPHPTEGHHAPDFVFHETALLPSVFRGTSAQSRHETRSQLIKTCGKIFSIHNILITKRY